MREYLLTLLLAAALCYVVTPLVRTWAVRFGAVAQIRTRDVHTTPTPRWGGLAMWISMSITFAIVNNLELVGKSFGRETQGIFLAGTFLVALGMLDDRFELDALTKLAGQALAAGILLLFGIQILWLPINGVITLPPSVGQLVTVLIVLVTINAVNFIDGLDGLAAGILLLFGIQILWLPINGVITLPPSVGQLVTVLIVLVTINAVNFIDGLDGLAAGIVAISGLAFFAFAYLLAVVYGFSRAGAPSLITATVSYTHLTLPTKRIV